MLLASHEYELFRRLLMYSTPFLVVRPFGYRFVMLDPRIRHGNSDPSELSRRAATLRCLAMAAGSALKSFIAVDIHHDAVRWGLLAI
jgi:hypothetical protein